MGVAMVARLTATLVQCPRCDDGGGGSSSSNGERQVQCYQKRSASYQSHFFGAKKSTLSVFGSEKWRELIASQSQVKRGVSECHSILISDAIIRVSNCASKIGTEVLGFRASLSAQRGFDITAFSLAHHHYLTTVIVDTPLLRRPREAQQHQNNEVRT